MVDHDPKVIVALDFDERLAALSLIEKLDPALCRLKVGKEMFTRFGPGWVETLHAHGFEVFLDLKFHDIPNTAAKAVAAAADLGVWMVNVHASGGRQMMEQCVETLAARGGSCPKLIAVTVLTSMQDADLAAIGCGGDTASQVDRLASLSRDCGLDGVVCSAQEAERLKSLCGRDFLLVTPGIRPAGSPAGDQQRIMTPAEAIKAGSDYLVVGRPITQSAEPLSVVQAILDDVGQAVGRKLA